MKNYLLELSQTELKRLYNTGMMPALFTEDGRYDFEEMEKVEQKMMFGYVNEEKLNVYT